MGKKKFTPADKTKPRLRLIHDVLPEDNNLLDQIVKDSKKPKKTYADALHIICEAYRNKDNSEAQTIEVLKARIEEANIQNIELLKQIETLKETKPEALTLELKGTQFICEPPEKIALAMKKVRRFLKLKGQLNQEETQQEFANQMAITGIKKYLNNNYSHLL